ncbi:hypothetical protein [Streptomyces caniscabiei]|uniref:hypothetical protein n=1 Tax=Streptomyces caniscabiei TaxID=2746961 RepID=UPI000A7F20A3|nr:hypothetical protein [Streptomyces caniscabiei]
MLLTALAMALPDGRHTAFLGAVTAGARVDFAGTDLFAAGSRSLHRTTPRRRPAHPHQLTAPGPRRIMTVASTPDSERRPYRESRYGRRLP